MNVNFVVYYIYGLIIYILVFCMHNPFIRVDSMRLEGTRSNHGQVQIKTTMQNAVRVTVISHKLKSSIAFGLLSIFRQ